MLEMSLIVLGSVGGGTEQTDERITPGPGTVGPRHAWLDCSNVTGQSGGQLHPGLLNTVPGSRPPAHQAVAHHNLALLSAAGDAHLEAPGEMFQDVPVETAVK